MHGLEVRWEIYVCADRLDPFLTYRLIEPAYQMFNEVSIVERNIENFDERVICDFKHTDNSCMNCHTHGQQRGDLSMFYIRGKQGGAILNRGGELRKITLNAEGMLSGTVYGDIHPSGRYGVFSTNIIIPSFHTMAGKRMEVYDTASDLTVADFDNNRMINLETGEVNTLDGVAGDKSDTYHSWSSDGRWFGFVSKRGDGQYGKPYFCHLDEDGNPSKPFVLPQKSAFFYEYNLKSFNVPDIGKTRTEITLKDIDRLYKAESEAFE